jgi:hypothetical protein
MPGVDCLINMLSKSRKGLQLRIKGHLAVAEVRELYHTLFCLTGGEVK